MFAQREPVAFLGQLLQDPGISQKAEEQSKIDALGCPGTLGARCSLVMPTRKRRRNAESRQERSSMAGTSGGPSLILRAPRTATWTRSIPIRFVAYLIA